MILLARCGLRAFPARMALRAFRHMQRIWWRSTRPKTTGVRAICLTTAGEVVLVWHSYVAGWSLPGGGVRRGEAMHLAVLRELGEEIGLIAHAPPTMLYVHDQREYYKRDRQTVFLVEDASLQLRLSLEIEAIGIFPLEHLPECHPSTRVILDRWQARQMTVVDP